MAVLSETCFTGEGHLTEHGSGFPGWSGHGADEHHISGVGFAVRIPLIPKLSSLSNGLNDCLMTLPLPLSDKKQLTVISSYAPTMTSPKEVKEKFHDDLNTLIKSVPRCDKLILLGNFNARVGTDYKTWSNVIGKMVWGKYHSFNLVLSMAYYKHTFACALTTRHHGCIPGLSTGI